MCLRVSQLQASPKAGARRVEPPQAGGRYPLQEGGGTFVAVVVVVCPVRSTKYIRNGRSASAGHHHIPHPLPHARHPHHAASSPAGVQRASLAGGIPTIWSSSRSGASVVIQRARAGRGGGGE